MKNLSLLLILSLMANIGIMSQNYVPFPTVDASWKVYKEAYYVGEAKSSSVITYTIDGLDTTINAKVYKQLLSNSSIVSAGIREENRKVYCFLPGVNEEFVLYDFNAQEGDTIWHSSYMYNYYVVEAIDSILIGTTYRKGYAVKTSKNSETDYLVEGIGSVKKGLLFSVLPVPTCLCVDYQELICFSKMGLVKYLNPNFADCSSTTPILGVNEAVAPSGFTIYPNPVDNHFYIQNNSTLSNLSIKITNLEGMTLLEKQLPASESSIEFNASPGLYNLSIYTQDKELLETLRLIKK